MADLQNVYRIDPYAPAEMLERSKAVGKAKVNATFLQLLFLGILAGSFIALGAIFYTTTLAGFSGDFGMKKLVGGLTFSLGLILVIIAGAELFTGNNLIVIALIEKEITVARLFRNWGIVYLGNIAGSLTTAGIYYLTALAQDNGALGTLAVSIAAAKAHLPAVKIFFRAILCNALVCLAVWLCFSARTNTDKVLCIVFPIAAFVACGFEHCVANMYFIPFGYALQQFSQVPAPGGSEITLGLAVKNIAVATLGNIIGGSGFVGLVYWFIYSPARKA